MLYIDSITIQLKTSKMIIFKTRFKLILRSSNQNILINLTVLFENLREISTICINIRLTIPLALVKFILPLY